MRNHKFNHVFQSLWKELTGGFREPTPMINPVHSFEDHGSCEGAATLQIATLL